MSRKALRQYCKKTATNISNFDLYHDTLLRWQPRVNLVSRGTLPTIWERHFLDSAQLIQHIPSASSKGGWIDIGTGAGFPGLVINLLGYEPMYLVESNKRKAAFLKEVIRITGATAKVLEGRVEEISLSKPAFVSARAVGDLSKLLDLAEPIVSQNTLCIFPRGKNYRAELTKASKCWRIDYRLVRSITEPASRIVIVEAFSRV